MHKSKCVLGVLVAMYMFYAKPLADNAQKSLWFMVGSDVGLLFSAIPARIEGFSRLKWPRVVIFLPNVSMLSYGKYKLDDYDVLFHMGELYVDVASERGQRLLISDYAMLSRLLRALVVDRRYSVVHVSEIMLRLVSPARKKPRRSSLLMCCGGVAGEGIEDMPISMTMQLMGADNSGNGSPICCVKAADRK